MSSPHLLQGELLGDGVVLQLLDLLHQFVDLELLLLLQVLLQLCLLMLQLERRSREGTVSDSAPCVRVSVLCESVLPEAAPLGSRSLVRTAVPARARTRTAGSCPRVNARYPSKSKYQAIIKHGYRS